MADTRAIRPLTRSEAGYAPQAPVNMPGGNYYANYPYGWNPLVPPPNVLPTRGVAPSPDAYQYPGGVMGAPWNDVQALIRKQKKVKGITFNSVLNQTVEVPIDLSGTGKILLGLKCMFFNLGIIPPQNKVSLIVNSELIIDKLSVWFLCNSLGSYAPGSEFFAFPRPLSGADSITLSVLETGASIPYQFNFYYL